MREEASISAPDLPLYQGMFGGGSLGPLVKHVCNAMGNCVCPKGTTPKEVAKRSKLAVPLRPSRGLAPNLRSTTIFLVFCTLAPVASFTKSAVDFKKVG